VGGIPAFKLERDIVFRRVEILRQRGVEFRLGVTVGREVKLEALQAEFDAVFLGFGAQQARPLDVPGADLPGVWMALPFIVQHNTDVPLDIAPEPLQGRRIVVLGGGDTAMDCLRISVRRGVAEAHCVYRRDAANMAASRREYENAIEEGARFTFQATPVEVLRGADGRAAGVLCQRVELGPPDATGRRRPIPQPRTEFEIAADLVVAAFGFEAVPFPANSELGRIKTTPWGSVIVDKNQMTNLPGVFACGDLVRGPSLVVQAVRDARKAAAAIHRYLIARRLSEGSLDATDHVIPEAF
jgi:glutamate synthase (NADPH/NADH) small chain